jgi:hypothetical protein
MSCLLRCLTVLAVLWPGQVLLLSDAEAQAAAPVASDRGIDLPQAASATDDDDDRLPFKLSLPTQADRDAWREAGFRLELGYAYGNVRGLAGAPGADSHAALVRVGARLDPLWSLMTAFSFAAVTQGLSGLRFLGTVEPTVHLGDHLQVAAGFGFGGLVEGRTGRPDPDATQRDALASSYTFTKPYPPLQACNGVGVAGLLRAQWLWVIGPLAASGASLQLDGQWTGCVENVARVEVDSGRPITRRQWWPHLGASLGWVVGWR